MIDEDIELLRKMREDKQYRDVYELVEYYKEGANRSYLLNMFIVFSNMFFAMFNGLMVGYDGLDKDSVPTISINLICWFFNMVLYIVGLVGASNDLFKIGQYRRMGRF